MVKFFSREKQLSKEDQSATETINNRLRKLDHKISELNRYWKEMEQTGQPPSVMPRISKAAVNTYPLEQGQGQRLPMTSEPRSRGQADPRSQTLPLPGRSSLGQPGRVQSFSNKDIPKLIKKGPIRKRDSDRRRTAELIKSQRSKPKDQADSGETNGHSYQESQIKPDSLDAAMTEPHVSQSYYPRSEDFSGHIPPSSYSYLPPAREQRTYPSDSSKAYAPLINSQAQLPSSSNISHDQSLEVEEKFVKPSYQQHQQSTYQAQPEYLPTHQSQSTNVVTTRLPLFTSTADVPSPSSANSSFSQTPTGYHPMESESSVKVFPSEPAVSATQSKSDTNSEDKLKRSAKYMIPDTLPITKSTPNLPAGVPPPKVDIMPKFHSSRRADSPPKSFQELLTKFQTGETLSRPVESREKQEVQKELNKVMKSRVSYLDDEEKVMDRRVVPQLQQEMEQVNLVAGVLYQPCYGKTGLNACA
ncbi:hypothetical protein DPMN_189460 [Dreissena polymorpha]|uniref:Uncharacterized protein n=1 Tax=Dreissena polymorpha TaxID=45954 RepID=A0A9D4IB16_DREPO|nr:hypothetical protein DPMN_189460 [Dreissena polymorpha]